jgi:putative (di)nucleoside polyphosphate hydrolase
MKRPQQYFRAGVGAVITNGRGRVLVFERRGIPGAWQFPQGGMDRGERPLDTAWREVAEETGLAKRSLRLLARCPDLLAYELPPRARSAKTGRGQVQYWFLFKLDALESLAAPPPASEFSRHRWVTFATAVDRVVWFKRPIYRMLRDRFGKRVSR